MMLYNETNLSTSTTLSLATRLKDAGFNVLFWESGVEETHTSALTEPLDTVSLLQRFPDDPTSIVGLNSGRDNKDEVVIPALSVAILDVPRKVRSTGLGETVCEREREILIQGLATRSTHIRISEILSDWLDQVDSKIDISDYTDPSTPTPLDPVYVHQATIISPELPQEVSVYRYQIHADILVRYFE